MVASASRSLLRDGAALALTREHVDHIVTVEDTDIWHWNALVVATRQSTGRTRRCRHRGVLTGAMDLSAAPLAKPAASTDGISVRCEPICREELEGFLN